VFPPLFFFPFFEKRKKKKKEKMKKEKQVETEAEERLPGCPPFFGFSFLFVGRGACTLFFLISFF
jgi:hypothetical protein